MDLDRSVATAKALADRSRLLILNALLSGPLCAEELAGILDLAPSTVSFHVKKLSATGLVETRRDQYYTVFTLAPRVSQMHVSELFALAGPDERELTRRRDQDRAKVFDTFFRDGRLTRMPAQNRKRSIVLERFAKLFVPGNVYTEAEVTETITPLHEDYCLVRRLLVEEGHLSRERGLYRRAGVTAAEPSREEGSGEERMDTSRRTLRQAYKLEERPAGIFRITNTLTGKVLLGSSMNLDGPLNRLEFELKYGSHRNHALQRDFDLYGRESFLFEIVEIVEPSADPDFDAERALEALELRYKEGLDRSNCYNEDEDIRFLRRRRRAG